LRKIRKLFEGTAADELLHAVAEIALADAGDGSIDGDDERGKAGGAGAFNRGLGGAAATHQIQLIEDGAGRCGLHVFEFVPGDGGENVGGARVAGGASCAHFAHGVHEPAVANGSEQEGRARSKPRTRVRKGQWSKATAWRGRKVTSS
jgi:hypothetical protein